MKAADNQEFRIEPVGGRLVVRRIKTEQVGRLTMTEGSKDLGTEAEVVAVGLDVSYQIIVANMKERLVSKPALQLKNIQSGDRIFISRFVGLPIDIDGTDDGQLVIIKAEDVQGIKRTITAEEAS